MSASSCACVIAARTRASLSSSPASGSSASERAIRPRRMGMPAAGWAKPRSGVPTWMVRWARFALPTLRSCTSSGHLEQLTRRTAQDVGAVLGHDDRIAEHQVAHLGMIRIGVYDQRHAGNERRIDVLQDMRLGIAEQPEAMATHSRPLAGHIVAETVLAKDIVLGARHVGGGCAGPHRRDPGFQCLAKDAKRAALRLGRAA